MNMQLITDSLFRFVFSFIRRYRYKRFTQPCTSSLSPAAVYIDGSWLSKSVTPDQLRITDYIQNLTIKHADLLHIGIGNSDFAKCISPKVNQIHGITIVNDELLFAKQLNIQNYQAFSFNKYSIEILSLNHQYDFIIDNNLTSYACCIFHFEQMLSYYLMLLKPGGKIITDKVGLYYFLSGFGLTFQELKAWEQKLPIKANLVTNNIIEIEKVNRE
jgi:hypothetical protein